MGTLDEHIRDGHQMSNNDDFNYYANNTYNILRKNICSGSSGNDSITVEDVIIPLNDAPQPTTQTEKQPDDVAKDGQHTSEHDDDVAKDGQHTGEHDDDHPSEEADVTPDFLTLNNSLHFFDNSKVKINVMTFVSSMYLRAYRVALEEKGIKCFWITPEIHRLTLYNSCLKACKSYFLFSRIGNIYANIILPTIRSFIEQAQSKQYEFCILLYEPFDTVVVIPQILTLLNQFYSFNMYYVKLTFSYDLLKDMGFNIMIFEPITNDINETIKRIVLTSKVNIIVDKSNVDNKQTVLKLVDDLNTQFSRLTIIDLYRYPFSQFCNQKEMSITLLTESCKNILGATSEDYNFVPKSWKYLLNAKILKPNQLTDIFNFRFD